MSRFRYVILLNEKSSVDSIGGKAYSIQKLISTKLNVPKGFVINTKAYEYYLIKKKLPEELKNEIEEVMTRLNINYPVITRSSATIEDSFYHSFAGQFISIFPINSLDELLRAIEKIYLSTNSKKVKTYIRFLDIKKPVKMAVIVQEFIRTEYSGVAFSKNIFENKEEIIIEIARGLGEEVVSGRAITNIYFVDKDSLKITRKIERSKLSLDNLLTEIAKQIIKTEKIFGYPVDVEFGVENNKIYIFQTRPITPKKRKDFDFNIPKDWSYLEGVPTGTGKVYGVARIINNKKDLMNLKPGEILVSKTTYNDWMPEMLKASGIINEIGNITSHSAIVAREFGIPTVVGVKGILEVLKNGMEIFVDADEGRVYFPGKIHKKTIPDWTYDFVIDLIPLSLKNLEKVSRIDVVRNPREVVVLEEYENIRVAYFHYSIPKKVKEKIIKSINALEGHPDKHWFFVEWQYGFLIHEGLEKYLREGIGLLEDLKNLDKYLYRTMKLAQEKIKEAYDVYKKAKDNKDLELFLKALKLVDLSSKYFGIANTIIPQGYGMRKLREMAKQYGDPKEVLKNIENYKDTKLYELYKILDKWKFLSDDMDVWDARTQLWSAIRKRLKEYFNFDPNDFIKDGSGYWLDIFLFKKFGIKSPYL